ncbi:MAG: SRPBCC domain-containing protein [Gemmatimonadetes bacterium]|jgi:uncharacterized protein YndB with AHSA1/START domain|nr:SRPBCC domain-containing protein [Gemmatimonadota bacterium]
MARNVSEVVVNASRRRVWDTLTTPELVKRWQYGSELLTDWSVGSEIRFRTLWDGKVFEQWGKVLQIVPNELARYSLFAPRPDLEDRPENYFTMQYRLSDAPDGRTRLEIAQEDNRPDAVQEAVQGEENPVLKMLKEVAESA